ncbi:GAF domain-containing protein [Paenibacillus radicis (ex Gao et al. 2016)]|uniref:Protein YtsP n=1 Tax=Paenibacillus radicis (ex Gao et al. 2016) TaxID=1737354 RepID=A0A917HKQ8_9BACL|nr:GAF domain-containing protein [Paenibacillus radicis (ex Gao et al. 2016)]GGG81833.1 protein YtsP [Paenibacillus radicis (ex Gao et al. 2016)]
MFENTLYTGTREENYQLLLKQLEGLVEDEPSRIANLANASALLQQFLQDINWVGFYLLEGEDELVLGPFQGKPACTRIAVGKGVCGTAVSRGEVMLVEDVHQFPGHIACDSASNSELVIPLRREGRIIGVLDIDSPSFARFDETDARFLTIFTEVLGKYL